MGQFLELLEESSGRQDVTELRQLYYGRANLFVSFTDNEKHVMVHEGKPYGIECLPINEVVGLHTNSINTDKYAFVFRFTPTSQLNQMIYSKKDLSDDLETIQLLTYVSDDDFTEAMGYASNISPVTSSFDYLMTVTEYISNQYGLSDRLWRRILSDLGYDMITYRSGVSIILDIEKRNDLDIVRYETFRPENRVNVQRRIDKANRLMWVQRNRFAKLRTPKNRSITTTDIKREFRELIKGAFLS